LVAIEWSFIKTFPKNAKIIRLFLLRCFAFCKKDVLIIINCAIHIRYYNLVSWLGKSRLLLNLRFFYEKDGK
jgi:hypothetical protein